jgi:enoyl-CoA hydratase/carnithine racemase
VIFNARAGAHADEVALQDLDLRDYGLLVALEGSVLTVTLNRPDVRNAMRPSTWRALASVGAAIDDSVRLVIIRGAGESFCAGLDRRLLTGQGVDDEPPISDLFTMKRDEFDETLATFQEGFAWLRDPRFLSMAVVHGHAVGGGFQLALACDVRIAAEDAQFCMREPAWGIVPDVTGSKHLIEVVGYSRALEITASARFVGAREAFEMGLVNRVAARASLEEAVEALSSSLTRHPHGAVTATKRLFLGAAERTFDEQRAWERETQFARFRELAAERRAQGKTEI